MADFPGVGSVETFAGGALTTASAIASSGVFFGVTSASTAWPAANLALFVPVVVPYPVTVYKMVVGAGATAAGNFDVGIYDSAGNRLVSSGATAKVASAEQVINVTDTVIGPGTFYLALAADGTNNYAMITPPGTSPIPLQRTRMVGVLEAASSYVLPSTVTFAAASTSALIPAVSALLKGL